MPITIKNGSVIVKYAHMVSIDYQMLELLFNTLGNDNKSKHVTTNYEWKING